MTLEICDLDQLVAIIALKSGLLKNVFLFSLEKRYPKDFAEMLARVEKYVNAKKA